MKLFGTYKATLASKEYIRVSSFVDFTRSVEKLRQIALKKADNFFKETLQNTKLEAIEQQADSKEPRESDNNNNTNNNSQTLDNIDTLNNSEPHSVVKDTQKMAKAIAKSKTKTKAKTRTLGQKSVKILNQWFYDHLDDPYPSRQEKTDLARMAGLKVKQVTGWFINKRMRKLTQKGLKSNF